MEFQRTVLADYAHIHRLMLQYGGWGDVMVHLLSGQRAFRSRSATRCSEILGLLYNESDGDWHYALRLIDRALQRGLRTLFWSHVTPLVDPIVCDLVTTGTVRQPDSSYAVPAQCRKETAACALPSFFADHRRELQMIADYLIAHPRIMKDQGRVIRLLTGVIGNPRSALGQASCWPLGDVIIALQVPTDAAIWTLDSDFRSLTAALGLRLHAPEA
ncbi:MAG: hypothetical protein ACOYNY_06630 [Caldilineaceae bacterium]